MGGRGWWACALLLICGCADEREQRTPGGISLLDERVDFGPVPAGAVAVRSIRVLNAGTRSRRVRLWREGSMAFRLEVPELRIEPGESFDVEVKLSALADGALRGALVVLSDEGQPLRAELRAEVREPAPAAHFAPPRL